METKIREQAKSEYQDLQEELEHRYGPAIAQDIVDQIGKAEEPSFVPGYMPDKAASEVLELFRGETRSVLFELKKLRKHRAANDAPVINLEIERLRHQCERRVALYFSAQRSFYRLYRKAMAAYTEEAPATKRFKKSTHEQELAKAA